MKNKNLDYNSTIGLFLILLILIIFTYINTKNSSYYNNENKDKEFFLKNRNKKYSFSVEKEGKKKKIKNYYLENKVLKLRISSLGGIIDEVFLKKYKAYDSVHFLHEKNLFLIKNSSFSYNIHFYKKNGVVFVNTKYLYFFPFLVKKNNKNIIFTMRSKNPYGKGFIEYVYKLGLENKYDVKFFIRTIGIPFLKKRVLISLEQNIFSIEKDRNWENAYTQVYYSTKDKNSHKVKYLSEKNTEEKTLSHLDWIAHKQQFFATIFFSDKPIKNVFLCSENFLGGNFLKKIQSYLSLDLNEIEKKEELNFCFHFYFGPLDYFFLKKYGKGIENIIPFGWGFIKWINKYFFLMIFQFLEKTNLNYGVIIILMTIVVKLILSPVTYKQYKLNAMMKLIRPEIDELNNKFKNSDPFKKQKAMMDLYKKVGINPMSGCLSTLLQIPIFYSLFKFFPTLINLRGKSFLWVDDLTSYDSIFELPFFIPFYGNHVSLLTLLYSLAFLVYTKLSNNGSTQNNSNSSSSSGSIPDMRFILYIMPIIMLLFINSYASGLSLYYFTSNMINIGLIFFIKKFLLDEKKILYKIQENKKKPKKRNYWESRIKEIKSGKT
ncbi:YidC/Oxa1 family insertase periplasmic-domain containing protein [Blattabacterium cuenoti]|uniref:YidC/Oxa1 family insertase periplasmic-domain containing protein n=1 Tax=Blattabacterium cuenoti TaxID=1653831 RepID=UPI00163C0874|nr:YidC/Oxa1 family insertase periplasmic-domain containing protein [Blattabacterium cuenoti]